MAVNQAFGMDSQVRRHNTHTCIAADTHRS